MVHSLLSDIGIVVVLPIRSSPLATSCPVPTCTGTAPVTLGESQSEEFLDKVSVMNLSFPCGSGKIHASSGKRLSRLSTEQ